MRAQLRRARAGHGGAKRNLDQETVEETNTRTRNIKNTKTDTIEDAQGKGAQIDVLAPFLFVPQENESHSQAGSAGLPFVGLEN